MSVEANVRRILIAVCIVVVIAVVLFRYKGLLVLSYFVPIPSPSEVYPSAPAMPAPVATPIEDILSQYEAFLKAKAPLVWSTLQPGLSDAQIDVLEAKYSLKLTGDLRALYRWRNGTPRTAGVDAFPDHEFVPLDVALANRDDLRKQVKAGTPEQQQTYAAYAGHRDAWVGLIVDLAGDGYFYDPRRSEPQGSFFFCFAEDGSYMFYPAFRNYLAAVVEGENAGVFGTGSRGVDTVDFAKAQALWQRFGAVPPR
jgi:cell wall assembly regulator SMI1